MGRLIASPKETKPGTKTLNIKRIGNHDLPLPKQETPGSAGYDLRNAGETTWIVCGARVALHCGFAVAIPQGMVGLIWPRSGLAVKHGVDTLAGVIDSDFRGELQAVLINHGNDPIKINPGDRIAQLLVVPCLQVPLREVDDLDSTERGDGGFGSTGES